MTKSKNSHAVYMCLKLRIGDVTYFTALVEEDRRTPSKLHRRIHQPRPGSNPRGERRSDYQSETKPLGYGAPR